jgi:LCP family protein required for cell wall assembly
MRKKFKHLKIGEINNYNNQKKSTFAPSNIIKYSIFMVCIFIVIFFGKILIKWWQIALGFLWESTVKTVSNNLWQEMIKDDFWNINIILIWVWWWNHQGWYLADSIIVASWNPKLWAITMISIPRDLYVSSTWFAWRVNWLFARWYSKWQTIASGTENLITKVEDILGLKIPYYLVADFQWFQEVVDTLWWVEIYVPETIHDMTYPDGELWYKTFHILAWNHILSGDIALKYARSRHTTSDFSRSQRQQDIIKAIINTALKKQNITNVWKLKELYSTYTRMVNTNISFKEIVGMFKYAYDFKHIFSFGLNTYCNYRAYTITDAWCFLNNGNREAYGGMAVMVPNWSTPWNVSFYDYTQRFAFFVAHNQWYLIENPRILIKNAIDRNYAIQNKKSPTWWANKVAVKLKKYWFNLAWIENNSDSLEQTTVITYWENYTKTIETLQYFFPINVVEKWEIFSWEDSKYDMEVILWNDFITHVSQTPFTYEK